MNINDKTTMYRMLAAGAFGNTMHQYFSLDEWGNRDERADWWGVRTLSPGGPCKLNCLTINVPNTYRQFTDAGYRCSISVMVDRICQVQIWAEVWESPSGLVVYGIEHPPHAGSWRELMPTKGRHWYGIEAHMILRKHLNANSYDDLRILLDAHPNHVVELGAMDRWLGTVPGRNAVVWEVRNF